MAGQSVPFFVSRRTEHMADEQELVLPYEAPDAPEGVPSEGQPGADAGGTSRQPQPDLDADPRFREWKSKMDRQLSTIQQEAQAERVRRQAQEAELERIRMSGMDDAERIAYERDRLARENYELRNQHTLLAQREQRRRDLEEISARTNVPVRQLEESWEEGKDDPHTIWLKALDMAQQRGSQAQRPAPQQQPAYQPPPPWQQPNPYQQPAPWQQPYQPPPQYPYPPAYAPPAQQPANRVDFGGGASSSEDRFTRAYKKAQEQNDVGAMLDIESAARQAGASIRK